MKRLWFILSLIPLLGQTYEFAEEYHENRIPKSITTYQESNGKLEIVKKVYWYKNGKKEEEINLNGKSYGWYENGQKRFVGATKQIYKDGEKGNFADGKWILWYENGQKDGEKDGLWTWWSENGQKEGEGTYNDGKRDELYTEWYENGQKKLERTDKDGEMISAMCWDEDGYECDCDKWIISGIVGISGCKETPISKTDTVVITKEYPEETKFIPYDDPPMPLSRISPRYPDIAQEAGIEGTVVIQVFVDKKGRVQDMQVLKGIPNTGLDEAAMEAIRKTRFTPAKRGRKAVGAWISIPVNFRIK